MVNGTFECALSIGPSPIECRPLLSSRFDSQSSANLRIREKNMLSECYRNSFFTLFFDPLSEVSRLPHVIRGHCEHPPSKRLYVWIRTDTLSRLIHFVWSESACCCHGWPCFPHPLVFFHLPRWWLSGLAVHCRACARGRVAGCRLIIPRGMAGACRRCL